MITLTVALRAEDNISQKWTATTGLATNPTAGIAQVTWVAPDSSVHNGAIRLSSDPTGPIPMWTTANGSSWRTSTPYYPVTLLTILANFLVVALIVFGMFTTGVLHWPRRRAARGPVTT